MKKWQIKMTIVLGSLLLVFAIGFVLCNFIYRYRLAEIV
jgi:uncharacterized membrane protein affecting hemolysin expression